MSTNDDKESEDSVFESEYYFKLDEAVQEVKDEFVWGGNLDKAKASAKLFGKGAFNLGLFAGKLGAEIIKELPGHLEKISENQSKKNSNLKSNDVAISR